MNHLGEDNRVSFGAMTNSVERMESPRCSILTFKQKEPATESKHYEAYVGQCDGILESLALGKSSEHHQTMTNSRKLEAAPVTQFNMPIIEHHFE